MHFHTTSPYQYRIPVTTAVSRVSAQTNGKHPLPVEHPGALTAMASIIYEPEWAASSWPTHIQGKPGMQSPFTYFWRTSTFCERILSLCNSSHNCHNIPSWIATAMFNSLSFTYRHYMESADIQQILCINRYANLWCVSELLQRQVVLPCWPVLHLWVSCITMKKMNLYSQRFWQCSFLEFINHINPEDTT